MLETHLLNLFSSVPNVHQLNFVIFLSELFVIFVKILKLAGGKKNKEEEG